MNTKVCEKCEVIFEVNLNVVLVYSTSLEVRTWASSSLCSGAEVHPLHFDRTGKCWEASDIMSGCDAAATAAPSPSAMNPRPRPPFSKLFSVAGGGAALFTFPPTPLPLAMSSTTSTEKATVAPRLSLIRVGED